MQTQFIERFNGQTTVHPPRRHEDDNAAMHHAAELSARRDGEVMVTDNEGVPLAKFVDGEREF